MQQQTNVLYRQHNIRFLSSMAIQRANWVSRHHCKELSTKTFNGTVFLVFLDSPHPCPLLAYPLHFALRTVMTDYSACGGVAQW